jgi:hypothetical protein
MYACMYTRAYPPGAVHTYRTQDALHGQTGILDQLPISSLGRGHDGVDSLKHC